MKVFFPKTYGLISKRGRDPLTWDDWSLRDLIQVIHSEDLQRAYIDDREFQKMLHCGISGADITSEYFFRFFRKYYQQKLADLYKEYLDEKTNIDDEFRKKDGSND